MERIYVPPIKEKVEEKKEVVSELPVEKQDTS